MMQGHHPTLKEGGERKRAIEGKKGSVKVSWNLREVSLGGLRRNRKEQVETI